MGVARKDECSKGRRVSGAYVWQGYKGSALNSSEAWSLETDSGRICVDGRPTGAALPGRPLAGDVVVLELDLELRQVTVGVEGSGAMVTVPWNPSASPVFLAASFRRIGWQVLLLRLPAAPI